MHYCYSHNDKGKRIDLKQILEIGSKRLANRMAAMSEGEKGIKYEFRF